MPSAFLVAVGYYVGDSNGAPESEEKQKRKEDLIKERTTRRGAEAEEERERRERKTSNTMRRITSVQLHDEVY